MFTYKYIRTIIPLLLFLMLAGCDSVQELPETPAAEAPIASPFAPTVLPVAQLPVAQALPEEVVQNLKDEMARPLLQERREEAATSRHSGNKLSLPRLVPSTPAQLSPEWIDIISLPAGQSLQGYLDVTAEVRGHETHDFSLVLLVNGRQVSFELGDNVAPAHLLRLPAWQPQTFSFHLPEPLPPGLHELAFVMHDDPHGTYAGRGVMEKHQREGMITFDSAAGRPFGRALGVRHFLLVGDEAGSLPATVNWETESFTPQQTDLLGVPLLISLTNDETDPLMGVEPAVVAGTDDPLYAFVSVPTFPEESGSITAVLVAIFDNHQVAINGQETLSFQVQSGQHYRLSIQIDWPDAAYDGNVHQLFVGVLFAAAGEWQQMDKEMASAFLLPQFARPVMVVPEPALIDYIRNGIE
jgi:hypothetical protein